MVKYLLVKPSFSEGNLGDAAIMATIKKKCNNLYIPNSIDELLKSNINEYEYIIYIGNDCLAYYHKDYVEKIIKDFLNANKKAYIINTSWGKNVSHKTLNFLNSVSKNPNFQIFMRDKYSYELIQNEFDFYNKPILTADIAFVCDKNENNINERLEKWVNKNKTPIIGINIHEDFKQYNEDIKNEVKKFIIENKNKYRFLFIPHDSRKSEYEFLKTIYNSCENEDIDGYITYYLNPEYEKYITSKLYFIITGRMHLSILTIPNGVPCIAIAYNGVKTCGSFEHWDINELVIEADNINNLSNLVSYICNNYQEIQNKIYNKKDYVENLVNKQLIF